MWPSFPPKLTQLFILLGWEHEHHHLLGAELRLISVPSRGSQRQRENNDDEDKNIFTVLFGWRKTVGEKEDRGPNGDIGIEGNSGLDGKGQWSEMVRACVKEGWWACEVKGKRKRGRPKNMWKTQLEKESKSVGLENENVLNRARWRVGVWEIAGRVG